MIRAAVTIGSNSTRMLCAEVEGTFVRPLKRGREETRLFLGLDEYGSLTQQAMAGCVEAVKTLIRQAKDAGAVGPVPVYATSATRDAANQADFLALMKQNGCEVTVLSGQKEAELAFKAAAGTVDALVTDIGGGSTELVRGSRGEIWHKTSLQLGASRLFKISRIESLQQLNVIREAIAPEIDAAQALFAPPRAQMLCGIGGTLTSLAAMMLQKPFLDEGEDNITVPFSFLQAKLCQISVMTEDERLQVVGIPPTRVRYLPHGLAILEAICLKGQYDKITVRTKTNLDALLQEPF